MVACILIHTSVKLVTGIVAHFILLHLHFNPHEREARDLQGVYIRAAVNVF